MNAWLPHVKMEAFVKILTAHTSASVHKDLQAMIVAWVRGTLVLLVKCLMNCLLIMS